MTVLDLTGFKREGRKISMLTCYDYSTARILNNTPVDMILVGDSAGMVVHGFKDTLPVTIEMMETHVAAVAKGAPDKFIVGDLPFLSFRKGLAENIENVYRLMRAGSHAVKLEGLRGNAGLIKHVVESGVPVIGHLGLTPQFVHQMGDSKFKAAMTKPNKNFSKTLLPSKIAARVPWCLSAFPPAWPVRFPKN